MIRQPLLVFVAGLGLGGLASAWAFGGWNASEGLSLTPRTIYIETEAEKPVPQIQSSELAYSRSPWGELALNMYEDLYLGWQTMEPLQVPAMPGATKVQVNELVTPALAKPLVIDRDDLKNGQIYEMVVKLPQKDLQAYLKKVLKIDLDQVDQRFSLPELAQHMYNIAVQQSAHATLNDTMKFGTKTNSANVVEDPTFVFKQAPKRVYASFDVPEKGMKTVLVKWHRLGEPHPFLFSTEKVDPQKKANYVYFQPYEDWKPGAYLVEVFDPEDLTVSITNGAFFIEAPVGENLTN